MVKEYTVKVIVKIVAQNKKAAESYIKDAIENYQDEWKDDWDEEDKDVHVAIKYRDMVTITTINPVKVTNEYLKREYDAKIDDEGFIDQ